MRHPSQQAVIPQILNHSREGRGDIAHEKAPMDGGSTKHPLKRPVWINKRLPGYGRLNHWDSRITVVVWLRSVRMGLVTGSMLVTVSRWQSNQTQTIDNR